MGWGCLSARCSRCEDRTIVPMLCVGMPQRTLCVRLLWDAERPGLHSHAERGNDHCYIAFASKPTPTFNGAVSVDVAAVAALFDQAVDFFNAEQFVERVIHP